MRQLRRGSLCMVVLAVLFSALVHAQAGGTIAGVVSGPSGPIRGVTVNIVSSSGTVAGSATTDASGAYSVGNLPPGTYTIQVVSSSRAVLVTGTGVVSPTAGATVDLTLSGTQVAGLATGGAGFLGMSTKAVLLTAAGAGAGVITAVALSDDPSPNR